MTSLTFLKYSAAGFGEDEPAVAGASQVVARQMQGVAGYRTLRRQVEELRSLKEQQEAQLERSKFEKKEKTTFYKPAMAVKTSKSSGALYFTEPVARSGLFSTRS